MAQIEEVFDDLRDTIGDKGFYILMGVGALFGLYMLSRGSGSSDDKLVPVTSVASYPDAVTNANEIIDTIQQSIDYSQQQIFDKLLEHSQATNDYINSGFDSQQKLFDEYFDEINGSVSGGSSSGSSGSSSSSSSSSVEGIISEIKNALNGNVTTKDPTTLEKVAVENTSKPTTTTTPTAVATKPTTTVTKPTTTGTTQPKKDTYTYTTKSGLNTSTSIVDALKATGVDSSFANRTKIAEANGITNYTGTASQNTTLLNKLKSGNLVKV